MTRQSMLADFKLPLGISLVLVFIAGAARPLPRDENKGSGSSSAVAAEHIGKGYELVKDQKCQDAVMEFRAALTLMPQLSRVRHQLGDCLFNSGRVKESRIEFERLRRETPGDVSVIYYLGRIDLVEGNIASAIRELKSVVSTAPFDDTTFYLGTAYFKSNDLEDARVWLKKATRSIPFDPRVHSQLARVYQKLGLRPEAEEEYKLSAQCDERRNEASKLAIDCSYQLETRPMAEAGTICQKLSDPNDEDKLVTLGRLYGAHGFYKEALEPFQSAVRLNPGSYEIQHDLGLTYYRLGQYREARAPLERAVALRPDFFGSNALLGATLYNLKDEELSYPPLRHAHELNPQDADTAGLLFQVSMALGQKALLAKKYTQGLRLLKEATTLNPSSPEAHSLLAEAYGSLGQKEEADRERKEVERLAQTSPQ